MQYNKAVTRKINSWLFPHNAKLYGKSMIEISNQCNGPKYNLLEPILELLLAHGNEISTGYRWGSNPTGYFCILKNEIDFALIESTFIIPSSIQLVREFGEIDYGLGTVVVRSA
jgi:hypothetical protein